MWTKIMAAMGAVIASVTVLCVAPVATASPDNAVRTARDYLEMQGFSRQGLIEQLEYEGYDLGEATAAVDSLATNYNVQAARSAKDYLQMQGFSYSGLVEQLVYEGYTESQAEYGASAAGA